MLIQDLRDRRVAVWGLGKEGWAVLDVLGRELPDLSPAILNDGELRGEERKRLFGLNIAPVITCGAVGERLSDFDVVIKSPGVSLYRPDVEQARRKGVIFTSSSNLWFAERKGQKTVCVTGTKGKSTTSSLIAHMLGNSDCRCVLAGNVGVPIISMLYERADVWVIELSSYQTADFDGTPSASVLLNLFPEHLDWHGSIGQYYRDKLNLFAKTVDGHSVVNASDPVIQDLSFAFNRPVYFGSKEGLHVERGWIMDAEKKLVYTGAVPLPGEHNLSNLCAALTVVKVLGFSMERAIRSLATFTPLPHRLSVLGEKDGRIYVDDSISTTPQSTIAALKTFSGRPVTVLLGGFDRGLDFSDLALFLVDHPVNSVIGLPDSGRRIIRQIRDTFLERAAALPNLFEAAGLTEAVDWARQTGHAGEVILLSPASPSYGQFRNFEERGEAFAKAAGFRQE